MISCLSLFATPAVEAAPNPNPIWNVDDPILFRTRAEPFDHYAVKDPTIVFSGGRYHMFYTGANASGGWQMLYSSASTLAGFRTAPHVFLSRIGESYFAAPEVFVSWSGTLSSANLYVETASGTTGFYVDDASFK